MDIGNMSDLEFRMTILKVLAGLEKGMEDIRETLSGEIKALSGEIKELKSNQAEILKKVLMRCNEKWRLLLLE